MPRKSPTKLQPVAVPTGMRYGAAGNLATAQKAIPLPSGSPTPAPVPSPAAPPAAAPGAGGLPAAIAELRGLMSPQGGPTFPPGGATMSPNVPQPISTMPQPLPSSNVVRLLPILETYANSPDASWTLRQYVRRLRASIPPSVDFASPDLVSVGP